MRRRNISVKLFEAGEDGWGIFANVHNKGVIVDNRSVLVSSINWNENSVRNNREVGIIIENESIARYYADVFFYDWNYGHDNAGSTHARTTGTGAVGIILVITIAALAFGVNRKGARK